MFAERFTYKRLSDRLPGRRGAVIAPRKIRLQDMGFVVRASVSAITALLFGVSIYCWRGKPRPIYLVMFLMSCLCMTVVNMLRWSSSLHKSLPFLEAATALSDIAAAVGFAAGAAALVALNTGRVR